jgi:PAS domain S-box-containing protein
VENAPEGIYVATRGRLRYLNPAALETFGATSDLELLHRPVLDRVHPDSRAEVAERIRQVDELRMTAPLSTRKYLKLDGTVFDGEVSAEPYTYGGEDGAIVFLRDVTDRAQHEAEREAMITLLSLCNAPTSQRELIRTVTGLLQKWSDCEAVGIRLSEGDDFPYYETRGFPPEFVQAESRLCERDAEGELLRDSQDDPVLECMCGNVISGRFDPSLPFFTQNGSFWTNSTSELLASTTEADRQSPTRNRCNSEGYESVALFRLAFGRRTIGLLQINDKRKGRFNPGLLEFLEQVASTLATALEQRFAQAAQWESEARYRSLIENMREGVAYCKMEFDRDKPQDYVHLSVNGAFEKLTGLKGVIGRRGSEVIPGLYAWNPELLEIYGRVSSSGITKAFETYVAPLGAWFSISAYGASRGHFVLILDNITERKQAEEILRASEERYRLIADNTSDVIWTLDVASGRITYVSPSVRWLRGYSPEEVLAQSLEDMMTPVSCRHATALLAERTAVLESGDESARTVYAELEHTCKDGSIVPTELVATLLTDERGHVTGVVGVTRDLTERKRAEAVLRESEERAHFLADTLDRGSQPFSVAYPDGRIGLFNAAFCNLVGYSPDELRTLSWFTDLTPPEWREVSAASLGNMRIEGNPVRYKKEYLHKDGSRVPVEVFAHLIRDSAGAPSHYFSFFTDLTERKRAQQALWESEQRYRELFENSQLGVYRTTPDGRVLLANPAFLTMLGYKSLEELAELNLEEDDFESGYDRGRFKDTIERHGTIRNHEAKWNRRDGSTIYMRENAKAVRDSEGAVLYYDGTVEDITERKRIADALRRNEERLRQVAEDAGVFVWEVDADGLYTYASSVVETILGYTPDELVGKLHYYDLFAPDIREELKAIATEAFARRRSFSAFLNANVRKDGGIVILETNGTPLLDAAGNLLGYRGTDRDMTDRARATEELRKHRDHLEELVRERTAELAAQNLKLADEVFARALAAEALKRSEARLQLQLDCMPIACTTVGPDLRIRSWNPGAEQVFGYSSEEAIGVSVVDLLVPGDIRTELEALIEKAASGDQTLHGVNDNLTKDGRRITCEWTNTPLVGSEGGSIGLLCMAQDTTARKKAEEALRVRAQELETFNKAMVGREKRLIELKEEINRLCSELGRPPAYPPVWNGDKQ